LRDHRCGVLENFVQMDAPAVRFIADDFIIADRTG
jgi:hypothetical protein